MSPIDRGDRLWREAHIMAEFDDMLGAFMEVEDIPESFWFYDEREPEWHRRLGISEPNLADINETGRILNVQFCPGRIINQTRELNDAEFQCYVTYLLVHIMLHQVYWFTKDIAERERIVTETTREILPQAYVKLADYVEENI